MQAGYYQPVIDAQLKHNALLQIGGRNQPFFDEPALTPPAYYAAGEWLSDWRETDLAQRHPGLLQGMHYRAWGMPVALPTPAAHPAVASGRWRALAATAAHINSAAVTCAHTQACPQSGIWLASVAATHPAYARQDHMSLRQAYVPAGAAFARVAPHQTPLVQDADITWQLLEAAA